jgi:hypothetical protein
MEVNTVVEISSFSKREDSKQLNKWDTSTVVIVKDAISGRTVAALLSMK